MSEDIETRRKRLFYQASYRGFKEADLLIGGFAKSYLANMSDTELDEFETLLKLNDRDLYAYATGKTDPPADLSGPVFEKLRAYQIIK